MEMYNDLTKKCVFSVMNDLGLGFITYLCKSLFFLKPKSDGWVCQENRN